MKKEQTLTQAQQAQAQQANQQGGSAMYFVTFPNRVSPEIAKEVVRELRRRFPSQMPIFIPKPPSGRKMVVDIAGITVIITIPYKKNPNSKKEQDNQSQEQGFTLKELIKKKT